MNSRTIKLVLVAAGAATIVANPAVARTANKPAATQAYAMASDANASPKGVYSVIGWDGRVVGADPDLNIRFQLMRDAFANEN